MVEYLKVMTLSDYGSWASIIGIVISFVTFMAVFSMRKQFMFRSRLEEHEVKLKDMSSQVVSCLNSYERNVEQIDELLGLANVELRYLQKGASGTLKKEIKKTRSSIRWFRIRLSFGWKLKPDASNARKACKNINMVIAELQHVQKENKVIGN